MPMTEIELARKALEELRTRGHNKRVYFAPDGSVCLAGAFMAALGANGSNDVTIYTVNWPLNAIVAKLAGITMDLFPGRVTGTARDDYGWGYMFRFNDHAQTTREDVELVVKHFIEQENTPLCTGPPQINPPAGAEWSSPRSAPWWSSGPGSGSARTPSHPPAAPPARTPRPR